MFGEKDRVTSTMGLKAENELQNNVAALINGEYENLTSAVRVQLGELDSVGREVLQETYARMLKLYGCTKVKIVQPSREEQIADELMDRGVSAGFMNFKVIFQPPKPVECVTMKVIVPKRRKTQWRKTS